MHDARSLGSDPPTPGEYCGGNFDRVLKEEKKSTGDGSSIYAAKRRKKVKGKKKDDRVQIRSLSSGVAYPRIQVAACRSWVAMREQRYWRVIRDDTRENTVESGRVLVRYER